MKIPFSIFYPLFFIFCLLSSVFCFSANAEVNTSLWQTEKSQHFIIYYQEAPLNYITKLIDSAERYYNDIVDKFGFRRFDFWSWDKRAKIYLYADNDSYLNDTRRAKWSGASVDIKNRTIKTFIGQEKFFDSILPHEMAHIIFREFIGNNIILPLWLDEGIACSQESLSWGERLETVRSLIHRQAYIGLNKLSEINDYSLVVPNVFYSEAASLVVFLIEHYGKEKFLDFARTLRDTAAWQEALFSVYHFKDIDEMELRWKEYFGKS